MKREEQKAMFAHMKQAGTYSKSKNNDGASGGSTTHAPSTKKFAGLGGKGARKGAQAGQTSLF